MAGGVVDALEAFFAEFVDRHERQRGGLPRQPFDAEWPSPCLVGEPDGHGNIEWRPVRRPSRADFSGLEAALEVGLHPDLADFYGTFWSDSIAARAAEGDVTLIQVWSERDFDRLVENVIGHALAKRRARAEPTVFVALTDEEDLILSVDNASGAVVLEHPGHAPIREVSPDLATLLARLDPAI